MMTEVDENGGNSDDVVCRIVARMSSLSDGVTAILKSGTEIVKDELQLVLPGFNIEDVILGLYTQSITWYETIYCSGDIDI